MLKTRDAILHYLTALPVEEREPYLRVAQTINRFRGRYPFSHDELRSFLHHAPMLAEHRGAAERLVDGVVEHVRCKGLPTGKLNWSSVLKKRPPSGLLRQPTGHGVVRPAHPRTPTHEGKWFHDGASVLLALSKHLTDEQERFVARKLARFHGAVPLHLPYLKELADYLGGAAPPVVNAIPDFIATRNASDIAHEAYGLKRFLRGVREKGPTEPA